MVASQGEETLHLENRVFLERIRIGRIKQKKNKHTIQLGVVNVVGVVATYPDVGMSLVD